MIDMYFCNNVRDYIFKFTKGKVVVTSRITDEMIIRAYNNLTSDRKREVVETKFNGSTPFNNTETCEILGISSSRVSEHVRYFIRKVNKEVKGSINEFTGLSPRAENVLRRAGINTMEDLGKTTISHLEKTRNCGKITVEEILRFCRDKGIELPYDDETDKDDIIIKKKVTYGDSMHLKDVRMIYANKHIAVVNEMLEKEGMKITSNTAEKINECIDQIIQRVIADNYYE